MEHEEDSGAVQDEIILIVVKVGLQKNTKLVRNWQSAGAGGIAHEFMKYGTGKLWCMIHQMFQRVFIRDQLPKEWIEACITSIFKKRDRGKYENYKDISKFITILKFRVVVQWVKRLSDMNVDNTEVCPLNERCFLC